ncbi:MAG TPA: O-antigen polymerase, partial [Gemmatimonadaceae bacterium]|nr:O-antigen polymerase [Gemmatimonadaceae bacterium]
VIGFATTFVLHRVRLGRGRRVGPRWDAAFLPAAATVVAIVGLLAVASWVVRVGGIAQLTSVSYGNRYLLAQGQGIALSGMQWMSVGAFTLYMCALRSPRSRGLRVMVFSIVSLLFAWTMLIGSRGAFVQGLMGLAVIRQTSDRPLSTMRLAFLGGIVTLAAMVYGAVGRSVSVDNLRAVSAAPLIALNPANAEFGSGIGTIADMMQSVPNEEPYRWGSTYVTEFAVLVPRVLWPDRPLSLSEWYAARFYPEVWSEGGAFSFSPVAEAYLNFGLAGVICVFGLIGALLAAAERRLSTYRALPPWTAVVYATIVPMMLLFSRMYVMAVIKAVVLVWLAPVVMIYVVARALRLAVTTPTTRARPA